MKRPARKTAKRDPLRITRTDVCWLRDYWFELEHTYAPRIESKIKEARASGDAELVKLHTNDLYRLECKANHISWRLKQIREALLVERATREALANADAAKREGGAS